MIAITGRRVIAMRDSMGVWRKPGWLTRQEPDEEHDHASKHGHA